MKKFLFAIFNLFVKELEVTSPQESHSQPR